MISMKKLYFLSALFLLIFSNTIDSQSLLTIQKGDTTICDRQSATLQVAVKTGVKVLWQPSATLDCDTCTKVKATPSSTTIYSVVADSAGKKFDTLYITVSVKPLYTLTIPSILNDCQDGKSISYTIPNYNPAGTIVWEKLSGNSSLVSNGPSLTFDSKGNAQWKYTTTLDGCSTSEIVTINFPVYLDIRRIPSNSTADTQHVCKGDTVALRVAKTGTTQPIQWSPATGILNNTTTDSIKIFTQKSRWYYVTANEPNCKGVDSVYVIVDSLPSKASLAIHPADTTVCIGDTIFFRSELYEPSEYPFIKHKWGPIQGKDEFFTPDSSYLMYIIAQQDLTYLRVTQNGACIDTQRAKVDVNDVREIIVIPSDTTICEGGKVQIRVIAPGVTDFEWQPAEFLSCTKCPEPLANPPSQFEYNVKGKFGDCPVAGHTIIRVNTIAYRFPDRRDICEGETIILNETPDNAVDYTWSANDPTFGTVTTKAPQVTPTKTTTYYMVAKRGVCEKKDSITIKVTPKQSFSNVSKDTIICEGSSIQLSAKTTGNNGTYIWVPGGDGATITVKPTNVTNAYVVVYNYGPGCQLRDTVNVGVIILSNTLQFPSRNSICRGETVQLNSVAAPNFSYAWTSTDAAFGTKSTPSPVITPNQTGKYFVTVTDATGRCARKDSITVSVAFETLTAMKDTATCPNAVLVLKSSGTGTGTYSWVGPGNFSSNEANPTLSSPQNGIYIVQYTYGPGCTKADSVKVTVYPDFNPTLTVLPSTTVQQGDTVILKVSVPPDTVLTNYSLAWSGTNGFPETGTTRFLRVKALNDPMTYSVKITNSFGCSKTLQTTINVTPPDWQFPNVFMPASNQELNKVFQIINIKGVADVVSLKVYSRWGQLVYDGKQSTIGSNSLSWDGRYNDAEAPSDVYIYVAEVKTANGEITTAKGEVLLAR